MSAVRSFDPLAGQGARVLILGSMPGDASLAARQYYAHPRNAFWPIMGTLCGFDPDMPYEQRLLRLKAAGIALWDVLQQCVRVGSLDSAIETRSRIVNDFGGFFGIHCGIRLVAFNGSMAESTFKTLVPREQRLAGLRYTRLPSTSPAHAIPFAHKVQQWREGLHAQDGAAP